MTSTILQAPDPANNADLSLNNYYFIDKILSLNKGLVQNDNTGTFKLALSVDSDGAKGNPDYKYQTFVINSDGSASLSGIFNTSVSAANLITNNNANINGKLVCKGIITIDNTFDLTTFKLPNIKINNPSNNTILGGVAFADSINSTIDWSMDIMSATIVNNNDVQVETINSKKVNTTDVISNDTKAYKVTTTNLDVTNTLAVKGTLSFNSITAQVIKILANNITTPSYQSAELSAYKINSTNNTIDTCNSGLIYTDNNQTQSLNIEEFMAMNQLVLNESATIGYNFDNINQVIVTDNMITKNINFDTGNYQAFNVNNKITVKNLQVNNIL